MALPTLGELGIDSSYPERKKFRGAVRKLAERRGLTYAQAGGVYVFPDAGFTIDLQEDGQVVIGSSDGIDATPRQARSSDGSGKSRRERKSSGDVSFSTVKGDALIKFQERLTELMDQEIDLVDAHGDETWYCYSVPTLAGYHKTADAAWSHVKGDLEGKLKRRLKNPSGVKAIFLNNQLLGIGPMNGAA